ncbi:MAG: Rieske (2Fe-2S) protein [Desulfobacterales bacterium]|jgi:cytochrome b6-f complex iron-sulfur subunit|nr:Rieske (2Fe-2S) protein [Desulfobacter sp.]MDP6681997.1 Rieske (2Fe-2S) protein [Desulfobacterales bacterium]MDP6808227.1 Rieske (2Fe-2S) protein [Desulfobacterales bacterium]|tara:strand:- start:16548 stop:17081 length:534 start_codon:yes stop_codon:yes gene_type:complete
MDKNKKKQPENEPKSNSRRKFFVTAGWSGFTALSLGSAAIFARFFFPRVLFEPPARVKIGKPSEFLPGMVDTRFKDKNGVWIIRDEEDSLIAIKTVCTHLGCTPNWIESRNKFKCPCHGSGFLRSGLNVEGPAPRPLDRYKITLADDGQILVNKSIVYRGVEGEDPDEIYPQSILKV